MSKPAAYQIEVETVASEAFAAGRDVLLVSPMGSGKTLMMGRSAQAGLDLLEESGVSDPKAIILTHRQKLFRQIAGDRRQTDPELRRGDVERWTGEKVGTYADEPLGGVDQRPRIVAAMAPTVAARLGAGAKELEDYDLVLIDEAHHARDESVESDMYAAIIAELERRNPDLRVMGVTATAFRTGNEKLNQRLENAVRHVVSYEQAIAAGRIVEPRTVRPPIVHRNGKTVEDMVEKLRGKDDNYPKMADQISAELSKQRPDDFWDQVVDAWLREAGGSKTICFTDSVAETHLLTAAFQRARARPDGKDLIRGVAVVASAMGDANNDAAFESYASSDGANVLVSCKMIGEGYNVPETDAVVVTNRCSTRGWYAQMIGRAMRSLKDKTHATVIDAGATSHVWGTLERQIDLQAVELALSRAASPMEQEAAIATAWHAASFDDPRAERWMVFPSARRTYFLNAEPRGGLAVFEVEYGTRKVSSKNSELRRIQRVAPPAGSKAWTAEAVVARTRSELEENIGWHAVARSTLSQSPRAGTAWEEQAQAEFATYKSLLNDLVRWTNPKRARDVTETRVALKEKDQKREERIVARIRQAIGGEDGAAAKIESFVASMLDSNQSVAGRRETLILSGVALREISRSRESHLPQPVRAAAQAAASRILDDHGRDGLRRVGQDSLTGLLQGASRVMGSLSDTVGRGGHPELAKAMRALSDQARRASEIVLVAQAERAA